VHNLDAEVPGGFDAAYAFDVIEHVDDPHAFLDEMEARARLVVVNLLEPEPGETALHRVLPITELLERAARHRVRSYHVHYARSHLVIYETRPVSAAVARWQRLRMRAGRRLRLPFRRAWP
jgi:hypothetical protein